MPEFTPNDVLIQMAGGNTAVVDAIDSDLSDFHWTPKKTRQGNIYAKREITTKSQRKGVAKRERKAFDMHRVILERMLGRPLLTQERCDHRDGDTLNNRRSNLRLSTPAQNAQNTKLSSANTSGYKGVYFHKATSRWHVSIMSNRQRTFLGYFETLESAGEAYRKAAEELHGEFMKPESLHQIS